MDVQRLIGSSAGKEPPQQFDSLNRFLHNLSNFGDSITTILVTKKNGGRTPMSSTTIMPPTNSHAVAVVTEPSSSSPDPVAPPKVAVEEKPLQQNRCMTCRKRVGLTGFKCKCGMMLCGTHRYPEQHDCEFDFKGLGKEQIAKANPVVKGEKLEKI
ncbi:hypothetical protein P8452_53257 [Trifolium repens]|nr:hypothetical protein P8452_53257 [Trifolium repens]